MEAGKTKEFADEVAIMVETEHPLRISAELDAAGIEGYETSWARGLGLLD